MPRVGSRGAVGQSGKLELGSRSGVGWWPEEAGSTRGGGIRAGRKEQCGLRVEAGRPPEQVTQDMG